MATDAEVKEAAELIKEKLSEKNGYDHPLWQGVLDLIERSEFGKKNARVEVESPLPPGRDSVQEAMDDSFDQVMTKMLEVCNTILGGHGMVSITPYTKGMGTRSMTYNFESSDSPFSVITGSPN